MGGAGRGETGTARKKLKGILFIISLALMSVAAGALQYLKTHQKLGVPGIKAAAIPGRVDMQIDLPARVLDFSSEIMPEASEVTNMLPKDTSFAQRIYKSDAGDFWAQGSIVMMGKDRTSIHKPEYCLPGHGLTILMKTNAVIPVAGQPGYDLPVSKWFLRRTGRTESGQVYENGGVYVFWFVADHELTCDHWRRIRWLAWDLLTKGVLQRWAYVSYYTECAPGREEAAYDRLSRLIAASVPEFQLPPQSAASRAIAGQ